jgi:hypothetical protein
MKKAFETVRKHLFLILFIYSFSLSWILALNNIPLYHYKHGFDGAGHIDYMTYIVENDRLPKASHGWETHQSPLYYLVGSSLIEIFDTWKAAQYINIFILWITIGIAMYGFRVIFPKNKDGMYAVGVALSALPMLNIFQVMVTNELMNTMWSLAILVTLLKLLQSKMESEYFKLSALITALFILGFYTKVSIIMIGPMIGLSYLYLYIKSSATSRLRQIMTVLMMSIVVFTACYPLYLRASESVGPSNLGMIASSPSAPHTLEFYTRLDWIPKVDMYNTQYYSMLGGAYNSFFNDGHNAVTPFVSFHKKAFVLWSMGFILLPLSLYGLYLITKERKIPGIYLWGVLILMFGVYVFYNTKSGHYSAARLTYETPIVLPYAYGLAIFATKKYLKYLLFGLLFVQMTILTSFYWIEPWWHVTKGF